MSAVFEGIVHGRSIQLSEDSGLPDGQPVRVTIQPTVSPAPSEAVNARTSLQAAAGSWTDDAEGLEQYLEWNRQQRKSPRPEISE